MEVGNSASSEAGEGPLLSPVLDFSLSKCEVKDQAQHVDSSRQEKHIPPASLRILTDEESRGRGRDDACDEAESPGDSHEETCISGSNI